MCLWLFLYLKLVDNIEEFLTKDHTMNMLVFKYDIVKQQSRVFDKFFCIFDIALSDNSQRFNTEGQVVNVFFKILYLTFLDKTAKHFTQKVRWSLYFYFNCIFEISRQLSKASHRR